MTTEPATLTEVCREIRLLKDAVVFGVWALWLILLFKQCH